MQLWSNLLDSFNLLCFIFIYSFPISGQLIEWIKSAGYNFKMETVSNNLLDIWWLTGLLFPHASCTGNLWFTCSIFYLGKFYFVSNYYILFQYCLMKDDSFAASEGLSLMQAVVTWCGPWRESEQHPVKTEKQRNGFSTQIYFDLWVCPSEGMYHKNSP